MKNLQVCNICTIFANDFKNLRNKTINLNNMEEKKTWTKVRKWLINKYAITLFVFAVILMFVGEQSWLNQIKRAMQIRAVKQQIEQTAEQTAQQQQVLRNLDNVDSLEKFAREVYYMHADGETVYIVE